MRRYLGWLALGAGALGLAALVALAFVLHPPKLAVPPQGAVLAGVTIVDPGRERLLDRTLTVRDGLIERIEPERKEGERRTPGPWSGAFVLPGLIDLHVHHPPIWAPGERELFGLLFLAHGVTSVRDMGTSMGSLQDHAQRTVEGSVAGPRLFYCGPILDGDPPSWPGARVVVDEESATRALEELASQGAHCAKVYNRVSLAAFQAIREQAAARGLPVVGHVPGELSLVLMEDAEVQHFTGLTQDWWEVTDERLDWYADTSRELRIAHTPTLIAFDRHSRLADYELLLADPVARLLPAYHREILWNPAYNRLALVISPIGGNTVANRLSVMQRLLRRMRRDGVPIRVGTDSGNPFVVPGASLHEELRLLAEAGLPTEEVWQMATRGGGEALDEPLLGMVREGAPADLLVFRSDPTRDLSALASLEAVVADGRLYRRADLEAALERQQAHFSSPSYDTLSRLAARGVLTWLERQRGP